MKKVKLTSKSIVCLILCLTLIVSCACMLTVFAAEVNENEVGATTYYLWGQNNNGPNFGSMTKPTGTFSYSDSIGYYYDLPSSAFGSGDYCFVISTNGTSGSNAASNQAIKTATSSGSYYLQYGNYSSYTCFHVWNDRKDAIRISFKSTSSGVTAEKAGTTPTEKPTQTPTQAPTQSPTQAPTGSTQKPTNPTTPTTTPGSATVVYFRGDGNWTTVTAYAWNNGDDKNAGWPGEKMTSIGDNVFQIDLKKKYANIIFSKNGQNQTGDLTLPGGGYIYDIKTQKWEVYDVSPLQVKSFTTDLASPQYTQTDINLSASATGVGSVQYKFSVKNSSNQTTVLKDFSTKNVASWKPTATGTYTLIFDFKDTANNTNQRTMAYEIKSDADVEAPIIKSVTPTGEILVNQKCNINVTAGGGKTGTNLLFYKYVITDQNNRAVNVPYYTLNSSYSFTPKSLGTHTLSVAVQASDNETVVRSYNLSSVNEKHDEDELEITSFKSVGSLQVGNTIDVSCSAAGGTSPYTYQFLYDGKVVANYSQEATCSIKLDTLGTHTIKVNVSDSKGKTVSRTMTIEVTDTPTPPEPRTLRGDADRNGTVDVMDAVLIQKVLANLQPESKINIANADADNDGEVTILDASMIQKHLARLLPDWPLEEE